MLIRDSGIEMSNIVIYLYKNYYLVVLSRR